MRTTLDIDSRLLEALLARHPNSSKTEAIETAIRDHVTRGAADGFRELRGRIEIEDLSTDLRSVDRR